MNIYYNLHLDSFNKTINRYYFQSSEVQMACYFTNWYDLPEQYTRSLIFCIARAQKPLYLTAGKFYVFSLETFGVVSYLSIIKPSNDHCLNSSLTFA